MKLIFLILINSLLFGKISDYRAIKECINFDKKSFIAIRSFKYSGKKALLIVNPKSLKTYAIYAQPFSSCPKNILNSRYIKILEYLKRQKGKLQNDGITAISSNVAITTDLCPSSKKGFEQKLYTTLIKEFKNPVPVTLFITKRWIKHHKKEFEQLKLWQREKKLDITWGNHTAYHIYHPKYPLEHNFVLSKEENLTKDILDLEIELLENGITPSIFFRFPGLVSNKRAKDIVTNLGLITIGSNCWLAKGQKLKEGSIILVHGNKNEPLGVKKLLKLIKEKKIRNLKPLNDINQK